MKQISTINAEGHILCHDITRIVRGVSKGVAFSKGHVITKEDIPVLLSLGKEHLYIWENREGLLHENDAAEILYKISAGEYMSPSPVSEGKIEVIADADGLLKVDGEKLRRINALGDIIIATRHGNFPVKKGDKLAGTRIIPLAIDADKMSEAVALGGKVPVLTLLPFAHKKAAIITTGNEVASGLIKDTFIPVLENKLAEFNTEIIGRKILSDDHREITAAINGYLAAGADIVLCSGGMSVDPDDKTPLAIKNTGANIISYGAPVLPGAMFLLAYTGGGQAIMGLPGCVMYSKRTIFDIILPRIMADDPVTASDLAALGQGGLCLNCQPCTFPNCGFGKGS